MKAFLAAATGLCGWLLATAVAAGAKSPVVTEPIVAKPHIVFILADDMGYGDVGAYNPDSKIATPHLDGLAAEGVRFTDAHSGGSTCVPSRYALLTGRFAVRAKLNWRGGPTIEEDRTTIASLLRGKGYATAMVGKWHEGFEMNAEREFDYGKPLRGGPLDRGFDSYFGMHASLDIPPFFYIRDRRPTAAPTETIEAGTSEGGPEGWNRIQGAFWREGPIGPDFKMDEVTPRFAQEAARVIGAHAAKGGEKPLFLYLALPSPHTPWVPSREYRGKSRVGLYGDFVMQVDGVVGGVLEALEKAGMKEDTLVMFSSDNGPVWYDKDVEKYGHDAAGPWRGMKADAWEGGHRVPLIARWPAEVPGGRVSRRLICFADVLATLGALTNEPLPEGAGEDSVSFLPELTGKPPIVMERPPVLHDANTIRMANWKLIEHLGSGGFSEPKKVKVKKGEALRGQLYDLNKDPGEEKNLYLDHPDIVEHLSRKLKEAKDR